MTTDSTRSADVPALFSPLALRDLVLPNRIVISPMCQHAADDGRASDWHLVHLGKFAFGGAGLIFTESTAVSPHGRVGINDLGLWKDDQVAPLARVVDFIHAQSGLVGVQLAHTGRKTGSFPVWEGGQPFTAADLDRFAGAEGWRRIGPSAVSAGPTWTVPEELDRAGMEEVAQQFETATCRALAAGFDAVELHFAHGYLIPTFLSRLANRRTDAFGGPIENRMRYPLEIASRVRAAWPAERPLFCRISAVDGAVDSWDLEDSIIFARELKAVGVDVVDVSSGGLSEEISRMNVPRGLGFQLGFAETIRREAQVLTQAVGMIVDGPQAEEALRSGAADLVAIGRAALEDPYWPRRAAEQLGFGADYSTWPVRHGAWLAKREQSLGDTLRERKDLLSATRRSLGIRN
ncbi:NADH:flavin oxidoreductase/NADH oxidase [Phreatobacter stygius]|uniref:NADH:flavin oxidoreductase/NADH oxidase n=1 Tax=Phreatobacter stygius TaxID=1940610 RepID=A0A4D7ATA1_9HYPH|nr:NADH:flavin oxidoreductase/NADH oxidase [Phreatobacter stygius]